MQRKWCDPDRRLGASVMLLLDITVVTVAQPSIREGLGASFADLQ